MSLILKVLKGELQEQNGLQSGLMKIGIVGGGFTGLTAGLRLAQKGHEVEVLEKETRLGGLAASFKQHNWDWELEYHYHHWFTNDNCIKRLVTELGLNRELMTLEPETSVWVNEVVARLDSPLQLLSFKSLRVADKLRVAVVLAFLKLNPWGVKLEDKLADEWLSNWMGSQGYGLLFKPLFESKFGPYSKQVNLAWFWARIYKRTTKLMYFRGGYARLLAKLAAAGQKQGMRLTVGKGVKRVVGVELSSGEKVKLELEGGENRQFDRVIITTPLPVYLKIVAGLPETYVKSLSSWRFLWAQNLVLTLNKKLLPHTYWLNINDSNYPFVAWVNHTNFVSGRHYGGDEIVYLGSYLPNGHKQLKMNENELLKLYRPYIKKIAPKFSDSTIKSARVFRSAYAQPIVVKNYSSLIPKMKSPVPGVYLACLSQVYPWDRGTNYAIRWGEKVAERVDKSFPS